MSGVLARRGRFRVNLGSFNSGLESERISGECCLSKACGREFPGGGRLCVSGGVVT